MDDRKNDRDTPREEIIPSAGDDTLISIHSEQPQYKPTVGSTPPKPEKATK